MKYLIEQYLQMEQEEIPFETQPKMNAPKYKQLVCFCFEDQLMNHSSPDKFAIPLDKWKNIIKDSGTGLTYGGSIKSEELEHIIQKFKEKPVSQPVPEDFIISQLETLLEKAQTAGTNIRVMTIKLFD